MRELSSAAERWAGPDELGRNLLVRPGSDVSESWLAAPRVRIDASVLRSPTGVLPALRQAAALRTRVVFEVDADTQQTLRTPAIGPSADVPLSRVGARFELTIDELLHLLRTNSVVATEPGQARWALASAAERLGARQLPDGPGDVECDGIGAVWLDGGPLQHRDPIGGVPIIPAIAVEHGSLRPFGPNICDAAVAHDQVAAITHPSGASRIIAPAGSGKTRVLTERARHLVRNWNLPPGAVTLVAYNRRAQQEMHERLADVTGVQVRTLNSIALAILNGTPPFAAQADRWRTLDEREVRTILGRLVRTPKRRNVDPFAPWIDALSAVRLGLRRPDDVESASDGEVVGLADVVEQYEAELERLRAVDFDGQIVTTIRVLLDDPGARNAARLATRVLLVDEFQDLTPAHVLLLRLLGAPSWNVFGVGDDDQTIYGYNGADPTWLIEFDSLVPGAGTHSLETNYRCPADVVHAADRLLRRNRRRVDKRILAAKTIDGLRTVTADDPVGATVTLVAEARSSGLPAADIAVLSRVNAVLAPVQIALRLAGVPTVNAVGLEFVERTAVRSALAWLRLGVVEDGAFTADLLGDAVRRPSRGLRPRIVEWVAEQRSFDDLRRLASRLNEERDAERVAAFVEDLVRVRRAARSSTTAVMVDLLLDDIGLAGTLASFDGNRRGMNATSPADELVALRQLAGLEPSPRRFAAWLTGELAKPSDPDGVVLATVHRVKGQEWPFVVTHLADRDQFPHRLSDDVEEERRIFHVALTRASATNVIVSTRTPSPFVRELTTPPGDDPAIRTQPSPPSDGVTRRSRSARAPAAEPDDPESVALAAELRELRQRLRDGKPAYVVFTDATLRDLVARRPSTQAELVSIPGIGPAKRDQYGAAILEVLNRPR